MKENQWGLFAKYFANEINPQEQKDLESWLASSDENRTLFQKAEKIWKEKQKSSDLTDAEFLRSIGSDPDQSWSLINEAIQKEDGMKSWTKWSYRIAASIAIILTLGWLFFQTSDEEKLYAYSSFESYQTAQDTTITLDDGTRVWLNQGATLSYPDVFELDHRIVVLEGEGYFEVKRDESRPFMVYSDQSVVRVLGTSFNVKVADDQEEVLVTVASGSVSLANKVAPDQKVILKKGEVGVFNASNQSVKKSPNSNPNFLSWKTSVLTFENLPLNAVLKDLETHYQVSITLNDESILRKTLTATFEKQSLNEVLGVICAVHNLEMNTTETNIILSKKK